MTILKLIPLFFLTALLIACGSENTPSKIAKSDKTPEILFESQKKVLDNAKDVEKVLADEEQKRKNKMKELGL